MNMDLADIAARLQACVERAGGKRALAQAGGISEAQLYRYLNGESAMPADKLLKVAAACDVDAGWLLTGNGTRGGGADGDGSVFKPRLMMELTQAFEELLVEYEKPFTPWQRARALTLMYESLRTDEARLRDEMAVEKGFVLNALDFLLPLTIGNDLESYRQMVELARHAPEAMTPQQALQLDRMAIAGNRSIFERLSGQHYFERMGQNLSPQAVQRLMAWVEQAQSLLGRRTLEWLDVGCGNGRHLAFLHKHCPEVRGFGVDSSTLAVARCRELERAGKLPADNVLQADFRQLPVPEQQMDVVFCRMGIYSAPWLRGQDMGANLVLREWRRVLKPGGLCFLISLHDSGRTYVPFYQYYTRGELELLCADNGFELVDFKENTAPSDNAGVRGVDYASFFRNSFEAVLRLK